MVKHENVKSLYSVLYFWFKMDFPSRDWQCTFTATEDFSLIWVSFLWLRRILPVFPVFDCSWDFSQTLPIIVWNNGECTPSFHLTGATYANRLSWCLGLQGPPSMALLQLYSYHLSFLWLQRRRFFYSFSRWKTVGGYILSDNRTVWWIGH